MELSVALRRVAKRMPQDGLIIYLPSHLVVTQDWMDNLVATAHYFDGCGVRSYLISGDSTLPYDNFNNIQVLSVSNVSH